MVWRYIIHCEVIDDRMRALVNFVRAREDESRRSANQGRWVGPRAAFMERQEWVRDVQLTTGELNALRALPGVESVTEEMIP